MRGRGGIGYVQVSRSPSETRDQVTTRFLTHGSPNRAAYMTLIALRAPMVAGISVNPTLTSSIPGMLPIVTSKASDGLVFVSKNVSPSHHSNDHGGLLNTLV